MKVLIMAGGTGGHIMPGLAYAQAMSARGAEVCWLGTADSMEQRLVTAAGIAFRAIRVSGVRGKGVLARLFAPWMLLRAVVAAVRVLSSERPTLAFGFGGYVAAPGGLGAALLRIPLLIHEQNARAGSTNRLLAPLAAKVFAAYAGAFGRRRDVEVVGNPVRAEILAVRASEPRRTETNQPLRILVIGGSQGARVLNQIVPQALAKMPPAQRPQVRHQAGRTLELAIAAYEGAGLDVRPEAFIDDMPVAYAQADLVICRAGALTLAEVMAVGRPAICVPLPTAIDDHQTANARHLVEAGGGWLLPEPTLTAESLATLLLSLDADRDQLRERGDAAWRASTLQPTARLVERSYQIAGGQS